jgi:patatin-like phospholipase/acyl hydrolase
LDGPEVRLVDYFDIIAGTSTGGLITSMISSPSSVDSDRPLFTAKEVVQFYRKHASKVFPPARGGRTWSKFGALNGPKYKPRGFQRLLDQYLESDPLLDRALTCVIIPAFDVKLQQPVFFSTWQVNLKAPTVALKPLDLV